MSYRFLLVCIAAVVLGLGCSTDEPAPTSESPVSAVEPAPVAAPEADVAPEPASNPVPVEADAPEGDGSLAAVEDDSGDQAPSQDDSQPGDDKVAVPPVVAPEKEMAPLADPVVEPFVAPEPGGLVEPEDDPSERVDSYPTGDSTLSGVTKLMAGEQFRWLIGSKDVAEGFFGIPVLINVWSCNDKDIKGLAKWLAGLESRYSDNMVSVLQAANDSERSLTSGDGICGLSTRPVRSHGIDLNGAVVEKLGAKRSPAVYVYNDLGEVVASHVGPISAGSAGARKIEAVFRPLMAPILEFRRTSSKP